MAKIPNSALKNLLGMGMTKNPEYKFFLYTIDEDKYLVQRKNRRLLFINDAPPLERMIAQTFNKPNKYQLEIIDLIEISKGDTLTFYEEKSHSPDPNKTKKMLITKPIADVEPLTEKQAREYIN